MNKKWLAGCICSMLVASVALAQPASDGQAVRYSVSASVEATDNRDAAEDNEVSNQDVYLRPRIELGMGSAVTHLTGYYEPSFRYRTDPGDNQNEFDVMHRLEMALRHEASERLRLRFSNEFRKIEDPQIEEGGSVLRADRSYIVNLVRASLNYDLGRLSNIDLGIHNRIRRYDEDELAALSDKDENGLALTFRHTVLPKVQAVAKGSYRMYRYEEDNTTFSRDFDTVIGALGMEYFFTPQMIGSLLMGMQNRSYEEASLDDENNGYVNAELNGTLSPDLRVGLVAGFGVREADVYPYPSQEYQEVRGYTDIDLTALLRLRLAATYRISTYDPYPELALVGGDEDVLVFDSQVTYQFSEPAAFMLGYRFEDIAADSTLGSGSYTRNTARAGISASF